MIEIPCTPAGESDWTQRTSLGGADFLLRFRWSQRRGSWSLDVSDSDGVAIASGVALVCGLRLLERVSDPRRPSGDLLVVDVHGTNDVDPGFADLGDRFALVHLTDAELA